MALLISCHSCPTVPEEGADGAARYAPVSEQPAAGFAVSVAFVPSSSEAAIRALLGEIDARISDGPSAIGLWQLSFADDPTRVAGLARLRAASIVESAQSDE